MSEQEKTTEQAGSSSQPAKKASEELLTFENAHSCCAYLGELKKHTEFVEIIEFLKRSRVIDAIATPTIIYQDMMQEFWSGAKLDFWNCESCLISKIQGQRVIVCEQDLREALNLQDEKTDPKELSFMDQRKCFLRMKYNGPITDGSLHKGRLCPQFKYLAHVLIHVFGSAAGGYDLMRKSISSLMVALVLNKSFNVSGMLMEHLLEPVNGTRNLKFLLYPRFLHMVFDNKYKDLKRDPKHIVVQEHMSINTLARMKAYKGLSVNERPPVRRLFGHLARIDYEDPGDGLVRHANSDSDPDNPLHPVDPDAKRKRQVVNVGAKSGKGKEKEIRLDVVPEPAKKKGTDRKSVV